MPYKCKSQNILVANEDKRGFIYGLGEYNFNFESAYFASSIMSHYGKK